MLSYITFFMLDAFIFGIFLSEEEFWMGFLFEWTAVTTAENGLRALELLGLTNGEQNTLSGVSFFFHIFYSTDTSEKWCVSDNWHLYGRVENDFSHVSICGFVEIQSKFNHNRLLHARDDRLWVT